MKPLPHLLLVEDDPTSRAFLGAALQRIPARVDTAADIAEAMTRARGHAYRALLIDAHLPDGSGIGLLAALRAAGAKGIALAHTASTDRALHAGLRDAGFVDVLVKPLSAEALRAAVQAALEVAGDDMHETAGPGTRSRPPEADGVHPPVWNPDAAARAVGGLQAHVDALRGLFLAELPGVRERIREAVREGDTAALRAELHRLHASCGFVGATRVAAAARRLQHDPEQLPDFESAVDATLAPVDR